MSHAIHLLLRNHRSETRAGIERIADAEPVCPRNHPLHEGVVNTVMHNHPRRRGADLSGVEERA
jgi:hypothetical protein